MNIEAPDYWKHVMTNNNNDFTKEYDVTPADIPAN